MDFLPYPFERLRDLVRDITPKAPEIRLTIGEPQFETPQNIKNALVESVNLLNKYPQSGGEADLKVAQMGFMRRRFGVNLTPEQILPTLGTREVLFNFPCFFFGSLVKDGSGAKKSKTMAFPNPFYQIYEGAAIASGARILHMNLDESNAFKPHLDESALKCVDLVILNSPNNPTGAVLELDELEKWAKLALEHDFVLLSDECYSEIYEDSPPLRIQPCAAPPHSAPQPHPHTPHSPPHSILEAAQNIGNAAFKNILCVNSISKRSSAPGLRNGFIAGDAEILKKYATFRTYLGTAAPLPLQKAAKVAWEDDSAPKFFREKYAKNLQIAREILSGTKIAPYTFYVWLKVADDLTFTRKLYENEGILVLPGRFLGRNGVGEGFVRLALVYEDGVIKDALQRLKKWL